MKLIGKISWLMGRVQEKFVPSPERILGNTLTEQERRLVAILEIVQVEKRNEPLASTYKPLPTRLWQRRWSVFPQPMI